MPDLRRLANEIELLSDENRRELNAALIAGGSTRIVSDSHCIDGYRELAQKCADMERETVAAVAAERELVLAIWEDFATTWGNDESDYVRLAIQSEVRRIRETSR